MFGKGLLQGLKITLFHAFEPDLTIQYPEEKPVLEDRFRGSLAYQYDKCIACGLCVKACPNRVLVLEIYVPEGSKKKQVERYTIDRQYCMFCNLCVEICPTNTLYFSHNFELTQLRREDIAVVYARPTGFGLLSPEPSRPPAMTPEITRTAGEESRPMDTPESVSAPSVSAADGKRLKQVEAIKTALTKSPNKILARVLEAEEDIELLAQIISGDDKKLARLAELMVDDRAKAQKLAAALVTKARRDEPAGGGETS